MKAKRHSKILELIQTNSIDTQEELLRLLKENGFNATQATVSRDIKELQLKKVPSKNKKYQYAIPDKNNKLEKTDFTALFTTSVINVDFAGNMVVLKTTSGMAQGVCVALDNLKWDGIIGTIAGDDTIMIVARNNNSALELSKQFKKYI